MLKKLEFNEIHNYKNPERLQSRFYIKIVQFYDFNMVLRFYLRLYTIILPLFLLNIMLLIFMKFNENLNHYMFNYPKQKFIECRY